MVKQVLAECIMKLNKFNLEEKRKGKDTRMLLDVRNEIVSLKLTYEDYLRGKIK